MKFSHEIEIDVPITDVIELFLDIDSLPLWQTDLISAQVMSGQYGEVGAETQLIYKMGNKEMTMSHIVTINELPDKYTAVLETPNVWNLVEHSFKALDSNKTLWICSNEYKCSGFVRLMLMLIPNMFKQQSQASLQHFKNFAEKQVSK